MNSFYIFLHSTPPPRMFPELKKMLQLSKETRVRSWFLFQYHTIIRIYGCEEEPNKLPSLLTPIKFSFKYIRQRIHYDHLHFVQYEQIITFKLPREVGLFLVKFRIALEFGEDMLQQFHFEKGGNGFMTHST
jgi:hypothetical protein